jgi:parvulin-like peptidyl-prolyl isomerase
VTPERRARTLLALGAAAGLALAAANLVRSGAAARAVPADAVATVNGVAIRRDDYLRALGAVAGDRRTPIDDADKRHVLDRLIDEELLLQHGMALGLARRDRIVRSSLVSSTMELLAASTATPTTADLRAFYDEHRDYFAEPDRLRVRQVFTSVHDGNEKSAAERAAQAARRLRANEPFAAVRTALGDDEVAPIPDALLPPAKLRDYVGESAARAAVDSEVGAVTDPIRSSMGFHVLQVVERAPSSIPPFDAIVDRVRAEYRRRADDASLRAALDGLRRAAAVHVTEALP